ncbi:MAG: hypothetical protein SNJ84_08545 [Verrucomicrobiia bacterium]
MNPEMLARMRKGSFARVVIVGDAAISGWLGADPEEEGALRLDGMILGEAGYLEEISLRLMPEDVVAVTFLVESPLFVDADFHEVRMEPGFFRGR